MTENNADGAWRELELGDSDSTFAVDAHTGDGDRIVTITQESTDDVTGGSVITSYDLRSYEAQSLIKTIQDALEQNNERNVVGYPVELYRNDNGRDQFACPQCGGPLDVQQATQCDDCGAQIELSARVTAQAKHGSLPPE